MAAEDQEVVGIVAADLAELDGDRCFAGEANRASVEQLSLVWPRQRAGTGVDGERGGRLAVAPTRMGGLAVYQVHRPGDLGFRVGDFGNCAVVVMGENAKPRRLALDTALRILESTCWRWMLTHTFGPDEELVGLLPTRAMPIAGWILYVVDTGASDRSRHAPDQPG